MFNVTAFRRLFLQLILMLIFINVDFLNILSLCAPPSRTPWDNITNSSIVIDIPLFLTLITSLLLIIVCLFYLSVYISLFYHFIPFHVNLCILKRHNTKHAIPYFDNVKLLLLTGTFVLMTWQNGYFFFINQFPYGNHQTLKYSLLISFRICKLLQISLFASSLIIIKN